MRAGLAARADRALLELGASRLVQGGHAVTEVDPAGQHHPVVVAHKERRRADTQSRIADVITAFAGSMRFVYIDAVVFALWMIFVESDPWPKLTLAVSLEAIFLSTFVMIGQNRQAAFQQAKADHDFVEQELELKSNTELTRAIPGLRRRSIVASSRAPSARRATPERPTSGKSLNASSPAAPRPISKPASHPRIRPRTAKCERRGRPGPSWR